MCLVTNGTLLTRQRNVLLKADALHKISISLHSYEGTAAWEIWRNICSRFGTPACPCRKGASCVPCGCGMMAPLSAATAGCRHSCPRRSAGMWKTFPGCPGQPDSGAQLVLEQAARFDWPDLAAPESGSNFCHGLTRQLAVLCDGTVTPCCLDGEGTIALGNLFTQSLPEILQSPRATAMAAGFAARRPSEELCRRCGYARRFMK